MLFYQIFIDIDKITGIKSSKKKKKIVQAPI